MRNLNIRNWSIVLVFCMMVTLIAPIVAFAADNILSNSGFETDADNNGLPDDWNFNIASGTPTLTTDTVNTFEGQRSMKIAGTTTNDRASLSKTVTVSTFNGYQYHFSIYQKTENIASNEYGTVIRILFRDAQNADVKPAMFISGAKGTTAWTQLQADFTIPYGTDKIYIEAFLWKASGSVWWDQAELSRIDLLTNNSLETDADTSGVPDGWAMNSYAGTPSYLLDSTIFHQGAKSVKINGTSTTDRMSLAFPAINTVGLVGQNYKLSLYQKTDNIQTSLTSDYGTVLRILFRNASNQDVIPQKHIQGAKGTTDWSKLETEFTIPEGTTKIYVEAFLWKATGTVWFDDLHMEPFAHGYISDPGFENDADQDGIPYGWSKLINDGNPTVALDAAVMHNGAKSLKMTGDSIDDRASVYQLISVPAGSQTKVFTFSSWVKTSNVVSNDYGTNAALQFLDTAGNVIGSTLYAAGPKGTTDWQLLSKTFQVPDGTVKIRLYLFLFYASGTVWWDTADVQPELLDNPSFEKDTDNDLVPDAWSKTVASGTPVIQFDNTVAYNGARSIKMTGSSGNDNASLSQTIKLPAQPVSWGYRIRIYHKVDNIASIYQGTALRLRFLNDDGVPWRSDMVIRGAKGTKDWSVIETYINVPYNVTKFVLEPTLMNASGTVWWDQAEVTPVVMVDNPSFDIDANADQIPDGWTHSVTNGTPAIFVDTAVKSVGLSSAKMVSTAIDSKSSLSHIMPLSEGYANGGKLSVSYKSDNVVVGTSAGEPNGPRVKLTYLTAGGIQTGIPIYVSAPSGTNNWTTLTARFKAPVDATQLKIELQLWNASGSIWWDSVTVLPDNAQVQAPIVSGFGLIRQEGRPILTWGPIPNASKYTLQYSQDPNFQDSTTVTVADLYFPTYTPDVQLADGLWYARGKTTDSTNVTTAYGPVTKLIIQRLAAASDMISPNGDGIKEQTEFIYTVQDAATVSLTVFNASNQAVRHLVASQLQNPGEQTVTWDGKNDANAIVPNGTYHAELSFVINGASSPISTRQVVVNAADTSGYRGLENNKDWSNYYENLKEQTTRNLYDDIDLATGRNGRELIDNPWLVANTAAYAYFVANAYHDPASMYYNNPDAKNRAILAFNWCVNFEKDSTGSWAAERDLDPNIDRFALAPLAEAYVLLQNDIDAATKTKWLNFLQRGAYYQVQTYSVGIAGEYPNQDQNYVMVVGVIGKILNDTFLLTKANQMLHQSDDDIMPNGGLAYNVKTNPVPSYQKHITFWSRYYEYTGDPDVPVMVQQLVNYYPLAIDTNGTSEYSSSPDLKQYWLNGESPIGPDMVAHFTGDGRNKMIANILKEATVRRIPVGIVSANASYFETYGMNTNSIQPIKSVDYGVVRDKDVFGFRGRWDEFSATLSNNKMSNTLAGLVLGNDSNIANPRNSGLSFVHFESKDGSAGGDKPSDWAYLMPPKDLTQHDAAYQAGVVTQNVYVGQKIGVQYTKFVPIPFYLWTLSDGNTGRWDWEVQETWILFKNRLIGLNSMAVKDSNTTTNSGSSLFARSRFVFGPSSGTLNTSVNGNDLLGNYNKLGFWISKQSTAGWEFNTNLTNSAEPGKSLTPFRSAQQIAIQKAKDANGNVSWGPYDPNNADQTMSYHAVFFPLGSHATAGDWQQSADNNIRFAAPQAQVHAVQIDADDNSGEIYTVISNQNKTAQASTFNVQLPNGAYTLKTFINDSQVPSQTQTITVTTGTYSLGYSLNATSLAVYQMTPQ